ncbi:MAG: DNA-processing protein DprA, partial [Thermoanaerobaculia bacterium]|nr:DNA-processing protein DprA [Thermoanaerobaculia bacterium]
SIRGSRRPDPNVLEDASLFARELALVGLHTVSGLALGVDSAAHRGALAAVDGRTVAVQARGLDAVYPASNRKLAERILERGAILSEFPVGTAPLPRNFPVRNRLIAALSVGTLAVQAARRSGTLITARLAVDLGRDVYAVPGPIFHQRAVGTNELVRDGAVMALEPRDVLEALPLAVRTQLEARDLGRDTPAADTPEGTAATVLDLLEDRAELAPDAIAEQAGLGIDEVLTALLALELEGRVRRHPGPVFHIRRGRRRGRLG